MAVDVLDPSEVEIEWLDLVLHRPLMQGPPAGVMPDAFLAAIEAKHVCKQIADANSEPIRFAGNASDIEWCAGTPVLGGHLLAYANAAPFDARQAAKIARGLAGGLLLPTQILPAITVWDCGAYGSYWHLADIAAAAAADVEHAQTLRQPSCLASRLNRAAAWSRM